MSHTPTLHNASLTVTRWLLSSDDSDNNFSGTLDKVNQTTPVTGTV
jgi:hypothetical protein